MARCGPMAEPAADDNGVQTAAPGLLSRAEAHRSIVHGVVWVSALALLGKLASAAKEMAVAWRHGTSAAVDAYLFTYNLIAWPIAVWFGVLLAVLVPLLSRLQIDRSAEARSQARLFRAELLGTSMLLAGALGLATWAALQLILGAGWTGLPAGTAHLARDASAPMAALVPLGMLVCLLSSWMLAQGRHSNTLMESLPAIVIMASVLLWPSRAIGPLVWGTVAGFGLQLACLTLALRRQNGIVPPRLGLRASHWPAFWRGFGPMLFSQSLLVTAVLVDQFSAIHLPVGSVATLSYANRILALLIAVGVTAVSRATLPVFSSAHALEPLVVKQLAERWAWMMFGAGLLVIAGGWLLGGLVVRLLFENGAFGPSDTASVTRVLQHGLLQLPFYFSGIVMMSWLSALGRYRGILVVSAGALALKIAANFWLAPRVGLVGIQWSTAAMHAFFLLGLQVVMLWPSAGWRQRRTPP
ncbi:peptidoglycan biosynthesis protein MviN/MurJ (putative lipid II flippase) [Pseudorhodoferax soli]|uniref:Peptidoglycan biosynthesis protein MviN/MurJ (Putative lipid II flippase) n=2 Tax=Pseudorhodoferax soli TaxID=545864 RepID=A0A368Y0U2_9BURK|nr:peptidoglycan biosynthesis protein MviN/MurJ (putative lipid II flippase) [Pseudorhodoferax soli]